MKHRLTKNWGLKLGSFLFAVALWIIVTNINDPVISLKVTDVPVTIKNANLITDQGQIYEVLDGTDVVDVVTISAPRSIIDSLNESNVVAVADMNDLTSLNTISIKLSTNKYNDKLESIKGSIDSVKLNIEDEQTKSLPLRTNTTGEVGEGYLVGDVTTDQNLVRISGPQSVVSQVTKALVEVDVSGFTSTIDTDTDVHLYNEDGVEITSDSIKKSISKVRVNVDILEIKTVPLNFAVSGTVAKGYEMTGEMESSRHYVNIAGKSKTVQNINSIDIPESAIDVTGATDNVTAVIDVKNYLPDGVILSDEDFSGSVSVTVFIEQEVERKVSLDVEDIKLTNVPDGYDAAITEPEDKYDIVLVGLASELDGIAVEEIIAEVDVTAWFDGEGIEEPERGNYWMPVAVQLPDETVTVKDEAEVHVHISSEE
jgi:YbbR domain-containing protein